MNWYKEAYQSAIRERVFMVIGLRVLAAFIDFGMGFGLLPIVFWGLGAALELTGTLGFFLIPLLFALLFTWPFLYLGIPTGFWGRTPGKWLCHLKVVDDRDRPPGLWVGLARETLKVLAVGSMIGAAFSIYQLLTHGITWYDKMCGTRVEFAPPIRLTPTQKNFRKKYKPNRF